MQWSRTQLLECRHDTDGSSGYDPVDRRTYVMNPGRFILVLLTVAALVVGAASLYWSDPWQTGAAAAASQPIPEVVSNITAGGGAGLSGVRGLDAFAAGAGLYVVTAASDGDAILVINVTDP